MEKKLKKLNCGKVLTEVSLKKYTSYHLPTIAKYMIFPSNIEELQIILKYIKENNKQYKILGGGSNLIFKNPIYEGILINLSKFDYFHLEKEKLIVGAGYSMMKAALKVCREGLSGLEFATGLPGTVGGAIYNNSGCYNSDMGYVVSSVKVLTPNLKITRLFNEELEYHYRTSFFKTHPGYVILEAEIHLKKGDKELIQELIEDRKSRRLASQPLEYPSAGSVFRNPKDYFAGKLIEDIGYKGMRVGGAEVSKKHANFIINVGNATGEDIVSLIEDIQTKVKEQYKIELILEQEIVI